MPLLFETQPSKKRTAVAKQTLHHGLAYDLIDSKKRTALHYFVGGGGMRMSGLPC